LNSLNANDKASQLVSQLCAFHNFFDIVDNTNLSILSKSSEKHNTQSMCHVADSYRSEGPPPFLASTLSEALHGVINSHATPKSYT
jgi:hypothetical protein